MRHRPSFCPPRHGFIALILLVCIIPSSLLACPNCKDAMSEGVDPSHQKLGEGLSYSILFMLGVPITLFGTGATLLYRAARRGDLPEF